MDTVLESMWRVPVVAGLRLVEAQLQGQIRALAFLRGTPDAARHQELRHGGLLQSFHSIFY